MIRYKNRDDRQTIVNAKHSLLFNNGQPWEEKTSTMLFDVTMGSYDGAETCELVGCYLLQTYKPYLRSTTEKSSKQSRNPPRRTTVTAGKKRLPAEKQLSHLKRRLQRQLNHRK